MAWHPLRESLHRALWAALLGVLLSANDCPWQPDPSEESEPERKASPLLDVGGPTGASWQLDAESTLSVTLRNGDNVAAAQTNAGRGTVSLLGRLISVGDFCWRVDVVCPQQVLPTTLSLGQPNGGATLLLSPVNRRGPLAGIPAGQALQGHLDGNEISFVLPAGLGVSPCTLLGASGILASAFVDNDATVDDKAGGEKLGDASVDGQAPGTATKIEGRVSVSYPGDCVSFGGTGTLEPDDVLEISVPFTATRR